MVLKTLVLVERTFAALLYSIIAGNINSILSVLLLMRRLLSCAYKEQISTTCNTHGLDLCKQY